MPYFFLDKIDLNIIGKTLKPVGRVLTTNFEKYAKRTATPLYNIKWHIPGIRHYGFSAYNRRCKLNMIKAVNSLGIDKAQPCTDFCNSNYWCSYGLEIHVSQYFTE